jgi:hypothetical protein
MDRRHHGHSVLSANFGGKFDEGFNTDKDPAWFTAERTPHRRY